MKMEISIEEKARRYDEAYKKVAVRFGSNVADEIFSRFEMSEDERTIRAIDEAIKDSHINTLEEYGSSCKEARTWLKAQLEKLGNKPVSIDTESLVNSYEQRLKNQGGVENSSLVNICLTSFRHGVENVLEELNLKQGEQKPAELSQSEATKTSDQVQKLAEWSLPYGKNETAEDLIALAECLETEGDCLFNRLTGDEYGKLLRELAKKIKSKHAEWSEEDKQILANSTKTCKDEQKPTDKAEPKFHKGEWIVWENKCYKVNYNGCGYELIDQNGLSKSLEYGTIDENAHLWYITKDAKDGDVLHSTGFHSDCIFIFNGLDNWKFDEPDGERAVATGYCCLTLSADNMEFGIQGPDCIEVDTVKPATNIQRNLLEKAMADAGWEFYFKKKELKRIKQKTAEEYNITGIHSKHAEGKLGEMIKNLKSVNEMKVEPKFKVKYAGSEYNVLEVKDIVGVTFYGIEDEPNHIDYIKAENCERVEDEIEIPYGSKDSELQEATYYIPKGFYAEIDDDKVVIKKGEKPTEWSEKHIADVFKKVGLAKIVREQSNDALTIALQDAMIELSKVILQPNPTAWSEEDERICRAIINDIANDKSMCKYEISKGICDEQINWLKSLKDRYTWKPSD